MNWINIKTDEELKRDNPLLYEVARHKGTETPHSGRYAKFEEVGMYKCAVCDAELFDSKNKFESKSGWPSFDDAIEGRIIKVPDMSYNMQRTEVVCARCGAHLGHLFDDGPTESGNRYCINSVSLDFDKKEDKL